MSLATEPPGEPGGEPPVRGIADDPLPSRARLSSWREVRIFEWISQVRSGRIHEEAAEMKAKLINTIRTQPRLITAVLLGALLWLVLPNGWRQATRVLIACDCSTGLYLVLALAKMVRSDIDKIRDRAALQDEGQLVILGLTTITALVSLGGIMVELTIAKTLTSHHLWQHIALAGMTVVLSWTFLHTMFAVHYAHEYYSPDEGGHPRD
jgi:uncharacterized membrane protein